MRRWRWLAVLRRSPAIVTRYGRQRPVMGEGQRFLMLSILIGVIAGLIVVCFHVAIELLSWQTVHAQGVSRPWLLVWPALGGGLAFALVTLLFPSAKGSGVNNTKAALYVSEGYLPTRSVPGKFLACSLSIGCGNPMGPEDPALQMGAGVASLIGRLFRLSRRSMRLVAPTGAAAGIAAAFNTPITGVLFVLEEVVAAWNAGVLGSIVLSAVSAVVVVRWFLGDAHLFRVPVFHLTHNSELLVYAVTGIVGGLLSGWFTRYVTRARDRLLRVGRAARFALPVAAGVLVGIAGVWAPEALGTGYGVIDSALHDGFLWPMLLGLGILKITTTSACFAAGSPGGMFAPTLFIGAMLGGGIGGLAHIYWPAPTSPASAYVLVGIGTFFAGVFRAPMTSIFMVFEVSGTYAIILPVMIANTLSYLVSRRVQRESLFHIVARQDGLDLPSVEEQREAPRLSVEDAMQVGAARVLDATLSVAGALQRMRDRSSLACLVPVAWGEWAVVERHELERVECDGGADRPIAAALQLPSAGRAYRDTPLDAAATLLAQAAVLPVTSRASPGRLLGTLTLDDLLEAYGLRRPEQGEPGPPPDRPDPAVPG